MLSPIQTRRHWLSRLVFEPREEAVEKSQYRADISLNHDNRGDCWHVRLGVRFGAQPPHESTFHCEVVFEGLFAVHPDFPPEKTDDLVRMNGGAILYGAAREMILNLTARSKHGPFELPTIDARLAAVSGILPETLREHGLAFERGVFPRRGFGRMPNPAARMAALPAERF